MKTEIRAGLPADVSADGDSVRVAGHAAVFNERTNILGLFDEVIAPGAFSEALIRGDDVVFLVNHAGLPLARSTSGTLTLSEDDHGLYIESNLDSEDPDVRSIVPKMKRGDLSKMSFAFMVEREAWDDTGDMPLRTIEQVSLHDVSIVTKPAYSGTDIALRSLNARRASHAPINQNMRRRRALHALLRARNA